MKAFRVFMIVLAVLLAGVGGLLVRPPQLQAESSPGTPAGMAELAARLDQLAGIVQGLEREVAELQARPDLAGIVQGLEHEFAELALSLKALESDFVDYVKAK